MCRAAVNEALAPRGHSEEFSPGKSPRQCPGAKATNQSATALERRAKDVISMRLRARRWVSMIRSPFASERLSFLFCSV